MSMNRPPKRTRSSQKADGHKTIGVRPGAARARKPVLMGRRIHRGGWCSRLCGWPPNDRIPRSLGSTEVIEWTFSRSALIPRSITRRIRDAGIYPYYRAISSGQDPVVTHLGKELVMLGSNNYLGLTNHPEVKEAAAVALAMFGTGCAGSRLLNGTLDIHLELEERLARFLGREDVLTFSTGFQVNLGVLSCLLRRSDIALLDGLNHASIIDGCRLGFGKDPQVSAQRHGRPREEAGQCLQL